MFEIEQILSLIKTHQRENDLQCEGRQKGKTKVKVQNEEHLLRFLNSFNICKNTFIMDFIETF